LNKEATMNSILNIPFYAKFALISIGAFAIFCTMYIGQHIILPLIYATIIAILLNPLVNFLTGKKLNRTVSIFAAVTLSILFTAGLLYFISMQVSLFSDTYPALKEKFNANSAQLIRWISDHFNIKTSKINAWIRETENDAINNMGGAIGQTLSTINSVLIVVVLIPVYLFMILFYKDLLLEFIRKLFNVTHHAAVFEVLMNSKKIIQSYLIGLLLEAAIIATLNSIGLLAIGIDYAIILGITGALLNVIPYIGGVIAIALPMIIAYVTKDSSTYALLVLGVYMLIQFIDNHFIIPSIVASKVKINALVSIIVVLAGGAIWGIPGMFLSIPLTAIIKVVFDHIEPLKPWGFLLGNIVPTKSKLSLGFTKKKLVS
jgi:predicted PurR-regulated permease PerM